MDMNRHPYSNVKHFLLISYAFQNNSWAHSESSQRAKKELLAKLVKRYLFPRKAHVRCLTGR